MGNIARMDPKLPSKCRDVSWPSLVYKIHYRRARALGLAECVARAKVPCIQGLPLQIRNLFFQNERPEPCPPWPLTL